MGDQPTNGPYTWGNGPKPKRSGSSGKAGGKIGAMAIVLVLAPASVIVSLVAYLIAGHLA
jgi:hypothetical protein